MLDFSLFDSNATTTCSVKVGDKIVVCGRYTGTIQRIWYDASTARTQIDLNFGPHGNSRVYLHDEGKTWHKLQNLN